MLQSVLRNKWFSPRPPCFLFVPFNTRYWPWQYRVKANLLLKEAMVRAVDSDAVCWLALLRVRVATAIICVCAAIFV